MATHIHHESPMELFKELVEQALTHQRIESSADSAFYLVQLLSSFVRPEQLFATAGTTGDKSLAELVCMAIACEGKRKVALLKLSGDLALFLSGFQSDRLHRQPIDYYIQLGGYAYNSVAHCGDWRVDVALFEELATNFTVFVDVLGEVSESCLMTDCNHLLRLYERWLHTGSERVGAVLRRQGIMVSTGSRTVQ